MMVGADADVNRIGQRRFHGQQAVWQVSIYVLRRIYISVLLLLLSSVAIFVVLRLIPGDPVLGVLGGSVKGLTEQQISAVKSQLGLNRSLTSQYLTWVAGAAHGNFGKSYLNDYPVSTLVATRAGATLQLAIGAIVVGSCLAVGMALAAATWRVRWLEAAVSGFTAVSMSTPAFITGLLLIIVLGLDLHLLPTQGYVSILRNPIMGLRTTLLPAVTLGIALAGPLLRMLRASMREVDSSLFVRTAEGKGLLRRQVVWRHVLPNASLPALNAFGVVIGSLLGGAVVVEYVFARPGLGTLLVDAILRRDYPIVEALVLLAVAFFLVASLVVDLLSVAIDPRLRRVGH